MQGRAAITATALRCLGGKVTVDLDEELVEPAILKNGKRHGIGSLKSESLGAPMPLCKQETMKS